MSGEEEMTREQTLLSPPRSLKHVDEEAGGSAARHPDVYSSDFGSQQRCSWKYVYDEVV